MGQESSKNPACTDDSTMDPVYERPAIIELGDVVELTTGAGATNTVDAKRYYW